MRRRGVAALATAVAAVLLTLSAAAVEADGETRIIAHHVEGWTYSFSIGPGDTTWDFGDGSVIRSTEPVAHSFSVSGAHTVTAVIGDKTYRTEVMIHDDAPPMRAYGGTEYRYAPRGTVSGVTLTELSSGTVAGWISWDPVKRCVLGTPPASVVGKTYLMRIVIDGVGIAYDLTIEAGSPPGITARFSVETDGLEVKTLSEHDTDSALYYWAMYDMSGKKVTLATGRSPTMTAPEAGMYLIRLAISSPSGSAEYSQIVNVNEKSAPEPSPPYVMYIGAALAILAVILIVRFV